MSGNGGINCSLIQEACKQCSEPKRVISSDFSAEALQGIYALLIFIIFKHSFDFFFLFSRICPI